MKTLLSLLILITVISAPRAYTQMVPDTWDEDLKARYPKATAVSWTPTDKGFEANFQVGDRSVVALYNAEGEWQRSVAEVPLSELPDELRASIPEGLEIKRASQILESRKKKQRYILQLEGEYDASGKLQNAKVEEEKDEE